MNYRFKKKIGYLLQSRHMGGHGIHSPSLFRLITEVIENKGSFTAYPLLLAAGENVGNMLKTMDDDSFSQMYEVAKGGKEGTVAELYLLPARFDRLLFRLVNEYRPASIAFYGATFGVTLMALALADRRIRLDAQVENGHFRSFCNRLTEVYEVANVHLKAWGSIDFAEFVTVQYPANPAYCRNILLQVLKNQDFKGVVVLCGIHHSAAMEQVWQDIKKDDRVRVSLDLFEVGIYICKEGLQKEDFVLRF